MEPARPTLQKLLADILNRFPAEQVQLEAWPFVCGRQVARRTQAVSFAGGVLRVEVPDAGWRAQLRELSGEYLAGLNRYGAGAVERIEFVLAGKAAPQERHKQHPPLAAEVKPQRAQKRHLPGPEQVENSRRAGASGNRKNNGGNQSNRE
jgi:hypothetical protein